MSLPSSWEEQLGNKLLSDDHGDREIENTLQKPGNVKLSAAITKDKE